MDNIKSKLFPAVVFLSLCWLQTGYAASITISKQVGFPSSIIVGHEARAEYVVANQTNKSLSITDDSEFYVVNRITGPGYCGYTTTLNPNGTAGSSCILAYTYTPQPGNVSFQGTVKEHINGTPTTVVFPEKVNSQIVTQPTASMPKLQFDRDPIIIPPGIRQDITVTNLSSTTIANNVKYYLPPELSGKIASLSGCSTIQPNSSCIMSITAKPDATGFTPPYPVITAQGSNTYPATASINIAVTGELSVGDLTYAAPGDQDLILTNSSNVPAHISSITFPGSSPSGFQLPIDFSGCTTIAPNGTQCHVKLTALTSAYGSGLIDVAHTLASGPTLHATATITVSNTSLQFTDDSGTPITDSEIHITKSPQTFRVKNVGSFTWQNPSVTWATSAIPGVTLTNHCTAGVTPGDSCSFDLATSAGARPGDNAQLKASGTNVSDTYNNVVVNGGLAMMPEIDPANVHLSYRAVKIENMTNYSANITSVTVAPTPVISGKIKYCAPGDSDCIYQTDSNCDADGGTLPAHNSCLVWFKAEENNSAGLGSDNGTATITANVNWPTPISESNSFNINYSQDLYAAGSFTSPGTRIAKWNGSSWSTLGSGLNGSGYALMPFYGDLYAGGAFDSAGGSTANYIARWTGANWYALPASGSEGTNGNVNALTITNNKLIAGGNFNSVAGNSAYNLGSWNGSAWDTPTYGVISTPSALTTIGSTLYVGGNIGGTCTKSGSFWVCVSSWSPVVSWNGSSWAEVGGGYDNLLLGSGSSLNALTSYNSNPVAGGKFFMPNENPAMVAIHTSSWYKTNLYNIVGSDRIDRSLTVFNSDLYAGGSFTSGSGLNNIAGYNGSSWYALSSGVNGSVTALTSFGNILYAGGTFTDASGTSASNIAQWNGSSWSALGNGTNGQISALTVAPSLTITSAPSP